MILAVFDEISMMKNELSSDDEVQNVIKKYQNSRETNIKKNSYWLSRLVGCYKNSITPNDVLDRDVRISNFNASKAKEVMRKYFPENRRTIISLFPEKVR